MSPKKPAATRTMHTLPFNQLSWKQFEQLALWLALKDGYPDAEHVGTTGSDKARDIVDYKKGAYFQCKNTASLSPKDIEGEVGKLKQHDGVKLVIFVVAGTVSANARDRARELLASVPCKFWCGSVLDAKVKEDPKILKDFFDHPDARNDESSLLHRSSVQKVVGYVSVDQEGSISESDDRIAALLSELLVEFEESQSINRIRVELAALAEIESKLRQDEHLSPDLRISLTRERRNLSHLSNRLERALALLALCCPFSLTTLEKAHLSRVIFRKLLELGGCLEQTSRRPLDSQGYTIEIFARPDSYPRQLQIQTSIQECEEIEKKIGFSVTQSVGFGLSCSKLPADFLWLRAFPAMVVATVWFEAYPNDDKIAAEKCDYDNWLFGLA